MAITDFISEITESRDKIRSKFVSLGIASGTDKLAELAEAAEGIVDRGAVAAVVIEGNTYTIPAGYHNGSGTVTARSDTEGDAETYKLQSKNVTPTKKQQSIAPDDGYYGLSSVTVGAIPDNYQDVSSVNAAAGDVLVGKIIVNSAGESVAGMMANNGGIQRILSIDTPSVTIPKGYHNGAGTVGISAERKTATPAKAQQTVVPSTGKVLAEVVINPIPDRYQDITGVTAAQGHVLAGKVYVAADGVSKEGTMPNNGDVSGTFDGLTAVSFKIPAGYTSGGTVSLSGEIEQALAAI